MSSGSFRSYLQQSKPVRKTSFSLRLVGSLLLCACLTPKDDHSHISLRWWRTRWWGPSWASPWRAVLARLRLGWRMLPERAFGCASPSSCPEPALSATLSTACRRAFLICSCVQRLVLFLIFFSALFAIHGSVSLTAYTADAPKKVMLQHLHEHGTDGSIHRSKWAVGAVDSLPVTGLLGAQEADLWASTKSGWEWQVPNPISLNPTP